MPASPKPSSAGRLEFRNDNRAVRNPVAMGHQARGECICRIDGIKVIQGAADLARVNSWTNKLRKNDVRQTHQAIAGEELSTNLHSGRTKLIDPSGQRGVRNTQLAG